MKIEVVVDVPCHLGESPVWHPFENGIYWLDITQGHVHAYNLATHNHKIVYQGDPVGGLTVQADGSLLLLMSGGIVASWKSGKLKVLTKIKGSYELERRFNDAIADSTGRVYTGTVHPHDKTGRFYRIDPDGKTTTLLYDVFTSNGMAFSIDQKRFYYTETRAWKIHVFDYDGKTGDLTNKQTFIQIPRGEKESKADGLAMDTQGFLWSASYDAGRIIRYSTEGFEERRIDLPVRKVTSLTFGGRNLNRLYITTAGGDDRTLTPLAGSLFRVTPRVSGLPRYFSRILL